MRTCLHRNIIIRIRRVGHMGLCLDIISVTKQHIHVHHTYANRVVVQSVISTTREPRFNFAPFFIQKITSYQYKLLRHTHTYTYRVLQTLVLENTKLKSDRGLAPKRFWSELFQLSNQADLQRTDTNFKVETSNDIRHISNYFVVKSNP